MICAGGYVEISVLDTNAIDVIRYVIGRWKKAYVFPNPKTQTRYTTVHKSFDRPVRESGLTANGTTSRFHDLCYALAGFFINENIGQWQIFTIIDGRG